MIMDNTGSKSSGISEIIYSKVQTVYCRNNRKDEFRREVRLSLEEVRDSPSVSEKILNLKLTDDKDPFFYYILHICEEDFKLIKCQQGLLVDFLHFSSQLTLLFQQCANGSDGHKFVLYLDEDSRDSLTSSLRIVEKNEFKHLCHLILNVGRGSDNELKQYMASQIEILKAQYMKNEKTVTELQSALFHVQTDYRNKCEELEKASSRWCEEKNIMQIDHLNVIKDERERYSQAQSKWQRDQYHQQQELERQHREIIKDCELQISELKSSIQANFDKLCQANTRNKELREEVVKQQQDINLLQMELVATRKQSAELDKDYHEKENKSSQLQLQNGLLKEELREKSSVVLKLQEQVAQLLEIKKECHLKLEEKDSLLRSKDSALDTLTKDLMKANEILARLQAQQTDLNSKLKVRSKISIEQEKVIEKKSGEIISLKKELDDLKDDWKKLEESEKNLKMSLATATQKLEEKEKTLQNNNNVITWLNRRLNEMQQRSIVPQSNTATSTPLDIRGWIKSPPDLRHQTSNLQNLGPHHTVFNTFGSLPHKLGDTQKNDGPRQPPLPQSVNTMQLSSALDDTRTKPLGTTQAETAVLKVLSTSHNPTSRVQSKTHIPQPKLPSSAYFSKPFKC